MENRKSLKSFVILVFSICVSIPLTVGQGTLGRVTGLQAERGRIEIDGGVYSITTDAIKAGASPSKTIRSFKEGHIVRYSAKDQRLVSITLLDKLDNLPY